MRRERWQIWSLTFAPALIIGACQTVALTFPTQRSKKFKIGSMLAAWIDPSHRHSVELDECRPDLDAAGGRNENIFRAMALLSSVYEVITAAACGRGHKGIHVMMPKSALEKVG